MVRLLTTHTQDNGSDDTDTAPASRDCAAHTSPCQLHFLPSVFAFLLWPLLFLDLFLNGKLPNRHGQMRPESAGEQDLEDLKGGHRGLLPRLPQKAAPDSQTSCGVAWVFMEAARRGRMWTTLSGLGVSGQPIVSCVWDSEVNPLWHLNFVFFHALEVFHKKQSVVIVDFQEMLRNET